ncbi:MAG: hypothetical protein GY812_08280 [Actinomycetia bacterium]|nr:hypothetical protein [Actinomycetes bacterium]
MAEPQDDKRSPAQPATTAGMRADRAPERAARRISTSLGIIVAGMEPAEVAAFVAEVQDAVPGGTRQEFLLLDDHTSPWRRDIVGALEGVGDAMRLVPKPSGGRGTEFDALSLSARSEFLVASFGEAAPVGSLGAALAQMWSRGADAVVILGDGLQPVEGDTGTQLVQYLGMGSLGLGGVPAPRVVVIRRWVARWLFSEADRALDAADEVADRARLLGLDLTVVDA